MTKPKTEYLPVLDGCRAVSIFIVMLSHYGLGNVVPGGFGVTVFFFVSGFLITRLLLAEYARTNAINLKDFYARRALRLYPAFLVMIAVGAVVYLALGGHLTAADLFCAIFYGANYHRFAGGPGHLLHPFTILWSLAVEEHYYLFFPFLVLAFRRSPNRLAVWITVLILAVTAWRWCVYTFWLSPLPMRIEHGTDTRIDSILFGSLLAVLLVTPAANIVLKCLNSIPLFSLGAALLLAALVIRNETFRSTFRFTIQNIGLFFCIGGVIYGAHFTRIQKLLSHPAMLLFGRWSYSLYLWNWMVLVVASKVLSKQLWLLIQEHTVLHSLTAGVSEMVTLTLLSMLLASASYYGIERPMVKLRRRFGSHADYVAAPRAFKTRTPLRVIPTT